MTFSKQFFKKPVSPTNLTTKAILTIVNLHFEAFAVRVNTSGIPITVKGRIIGWRPSTSKGMPDIDGCYKGFSFKVEVKTGKDKLSINQIEFIERYEKAGGKCFIVKDSIDFESQFKKYFKID